VSTTQFIAGQLAGWETGAGPAALFLHGGPGMTDYGAHCRQEASGWRFVSYQQRGLEPSTLDGPFSVEQHVADAVTVLDGIGVRRAVVVGHSWGAHLGLHLAVARPDRVAGLVLIDGLGVIGDGGVADSAAALTARMLPAAAERMAQITGQLDGKEPDAEVAAEMLALRWPGYYADPLHAPPPFGLPLSIPANAETFASIFAHLDAGFAGQLAGLAIPVVSVLGDSSPIPVRQGEQTAALIPAAEVRVIPEAGHMPWHERPGCVADALARVGELAGVLEAPAGP
jgi:proline iminopeptidase